MYLKYLSDYDFYGWPSWKTGHQKHKNLIIDIIITKI